MRILYYNWVDYLDDEGRGGGVTLYQRNLIRALEGRAGVEVRFLSSGISYDLTGGKPRWEAVRHGPSENRAKRYEIVNSGVLSPSHHSFGSPAQVAHAATRDCFFDFLRATGPYDVVHFHNLEGLPAEVLDLRQRFPRTRVLLTLHNYYPFCPQVNLWFRERAHCADFDGGRKCATCLESRHDPRAVRLADAVAFRLKKNGIRPGTRLFDSVFRPSLRVARRGLAAVRGARPRSAAAAHMPGVLRELGGASGDPDGVFSVRRGAFVDAINRGCDRVLGVSRRVTEIAGQQGIRPELLATSYIGTAAAEAWGRTAPRPSFPRADGTLGLGFLGYMRRDKGFFFLLDALESLPDPLAARIRLIVAARATDDDAMRRLGALSERFASVRHADGYRHDQLDALAAEIDLGVVPVLWEDNLPQVALELHARHVPLLCADRGGARELANAPAMVFPAGDTAALTGRLQAVLDGGVTAAEYWQAAVPPTTMDQHVAELMTLYEAARG